MRPQCWDSSKAFRLLQYLWNAHGRLQLYAISLLWQSWGKAAILVVYQLQIRHPEDAMEAGWADVLGVCDVLVANAEQSFLANLAGKGRT